MSRLSRSSAAKGATANSTNTSDHESQKENQMGGSARVKMEKLRHNRSTSMKSAKKAQGYDEMDAGEEGEERDDGPDADADADGDFVAENDEERDEESGSPKGHKRARVNSNGDSWPSTSQPGTIPRSVTLPRDPTDGFIPGSITRVQLRNFVTYDFVEFRPGPYLNMIIGPNGTGKSSIACAIALGLNFSPKVLGRAEEIHAFVKNGTGDGHIEIELKSPRGKPNLVIKRKLQATSRTSSFTLNGKNATGREVSLRMADLGVQVGNLCSFLPQDKVSEFAMMSSQQLLKETEKAAGDSNLTSWHENLIEIGKECRVMKEKIQSEESQLTQMHARNAAIENEVERYHERQKIEDTIKMLTVFIPCATYRELLTKFNEVKELQRKSYKKVRRLKAKNEPAHELLNTLKVDIKQRDCARETRKKDTQKIFHDMQKVHGHNEELENLSENLQTRLDQLAQAEKARHQQIRELESKIQRMQEDLDRRLPEEVKQVLEDKDGRIKQEKVEINRERNEISARRDELDEKLRAKMDSKAFMMRKVEDTQKQLHNLDSVDHQKLQRLQRFNRDTADAVLWLRANKSRFKMEIIEPALMTLTIPDRRYQAAVENMMGALRLKTFVAQCQEDYDLLNELVNDQGALGRKAWISSYYRGTGTHLAPPPMSAAEMQGLGFDGYLSDFVNCPEPMLTFLMNDMALHRIAVAHKPNSVDVSAATQAVARVGTGASFIIGAVVNSVSRSAYGKRAISNSTRQLKAVKLLVNTTVDADAKREIESEISRLKVDVKAIDEEIETLKQEGRNIEEETQDVDKRGQAIQARITAATKKKSEKVQLGHSLQRDKNILKQKKDAPSADEERTEIRAQLVNIAKKRVKVVKDYLALAKRVVVEQQETTRIGFEFLQLNANKTALEELCNKKDEKYNRALADFGKLDIEYNTVKQRSKAALNESRDALDNTTEEIHKQYEDSQIKRTEYEQALKTAEASNSAPPSAEGVDLRTADEYRAELETQEAQLELVSKTQPGVIEQYEKRKKDIKQLEKTLEERKRNAVKIERTLNSILDHWKPALESLVGSIGQKFSSAFDRIGCAGEIRISENEDYDKWAIDILVKFRDEEKLQLLTGQRQSGGERSLTTILYLMSLTEEARAPFSLVDEINQGMDQRAERVVHDNMVDVTCKDDSAQYFLITPKLLPDLKYHARMKILCVNNGEWLPEDTRVGSLMNLIEGYMSQRNRNLNGH
ncbi:hypothetical protein D9757_000066 [Collybiopsis confluens]|uniref:Structural maintenance of chromosomes protein 5 n=1 Tax=Collybiopsis confluens TaxID=2823264 RepID=A0A8H5I215_9AGAR|nr:hypothetical protein D9757_000066 [Collybiopsis confluens]